MYRFTTFIFVLILIFSLSFTCFASYDFVIDLPAMTYLPMVINIPTGSYEYSLSILGDSVSGVSSVYFGNIVINGLLSLNCYYMPISISTDDVILNITFFAEHHADEGYTYVGFVDESGNLLHFIDGDTCSVSLRQIINTPLSESINNGLSSFLSYIGLIFNSFIRSDFSILIFIGIAISLLLFSFKFLKGL